MKHIRINASIGQDVRVIYARAKATHQCNGYRGQITTPVLLQWRIRMDIEYVSSPRKRCTPPYMIASGRAAFR